MSKLERLLPDGLPLGSGRPGDGDQQVAMLKRKANREREARKEAERILEEKSLELYEANTHLKLLNDDLERLVLERTEALRKSIEHVEEQQRLAEHIARHDALTGLPNRRFLSEFLDASPENWRNATILYIDLDRFKQINDTLGHAAGDALLREVADRLKSYSPEGSVVARIGGDEFVILVPPLDQEEAGLELADEIVRRLPEPIEFEGNILRFGTSVGVSKFHPGHISHEDIIIEADLALYRAKEAGRGCAVLFSDDMREISRQRKKLSDDLVVGLEADQIRPVYQPRICTKTGEIACVEALARWHHPELGVLTPDVFLSIAEDIGRLAEIDEVILRHAIEDMRTWDAANVRIPRVSVNVSGRRLMQPDLMARLDRLDIPRDRVAFELLESVFFDAADSETLEVLETIRTRGIRIEIDDFGSGHASINGLLAVRPETLKIDRHLVSAALDQKEPIELLRAVVMIGSALDIEVVAEGVETEAQIAMCKSMGCHQIQGFGISRPVPSEQLLDFAAKLDGSIAK